MTVGELIRELGTLPFETEVRYECYDDGGHRALKGVDWVFDHDGSRYILLHDFEEK